MARLSCLLAGLVAVTAAAGAPALARDVRSVHQQIVYYDVAGSTVPEILEDLQRKKPADAEGYLSIARFVFEWRWSTRTITDAAGAAACQAFNASVVVHVDVVIPRHPTISEAPPEVQEKWQKFFDATLAHELQHVADFAETGFGIPAAFDGTEAPDCEQVAAKVNAIGAEFQQRAQQLGVDFDVLTNHGVRDGAILVP